MSDRELTLTAKEEAWEKEWLKQLDIASDSLDISSWERFFQPDAIARLGNSPELRGWAEIQAALMPVLSSLSLMKHTVVHTTFVPPEGVVYHSCLVSYKVKGDETDEQFDLPALAVISKELGTQEWQLSRFEVFNDLSPVLLRVKEVMAKEAAAQQ
ncbi:hypothetical protein JCM10213_003803 [Rhodosporidiobolus nylandii]